MTYAIPLGDIVYIVTNDESLLNVTVVALQKTHAIEILNLGSGVRSLTATYNGGAYNMVER